MDQVSRLPYKGSGYIHLRATSSDLFDVAETGQNIDGNAYRCASFMNKKEAANSTDFELLSQIVSEATLKAPYKRMAGMAILVTNILDACLNMFSIIIKRFCD